MTSAAPALELRDLVKAYGEIRAVDGVSLRVEPGEFVTLLGPSGCGKTSLLNMIAGFFPPSSGRILLAGKDVTNTAAYLRNVGVVFQNYALFPHMTVAQNIAFGLEERRMKRADIDRRVRQALDMVKLGEFGARRPAQLSGGQQQRVALARALVIEPQLLLLDEPLSALDKNLRTEMQIEIKQIQRQTGIAAIFVTHDQNEALSMSDRIAVLKQGKIEQIGSARDIYCAPRSGYVASFVGDINRFPGTICRSDATEIMVDLGGGTVLCAAAERGRFITGSKVEIFVRPEDITLGLPKAGQSNVLAGTVAAHSYQGSFTHVVVDLPGMQPVLLAIPGGDVVARHAPGSPVHVRLDLTRASILPG
jgi:putative spermidine/putrescine transport system ATP-binding protein